MLSKTQLYLPFAIFQVHLRHRCPLLQVASELLNFLTSEGRMYAFLSKIDLGCQPFQWYSRPHKLRTGILRVSRVVVNERALPGGALYERFLNTMEGHVADLGGKLHDRWSIEEND